MFVGKTEAGPAVSTGFFQGQTMTLTRSLVLFSAFPQEVASASWNRRGQDLGPLLCLCGGSQGVSRQILGSAHPWGCPHRPLTLLGAMGHSLLPTPFLTSAPLLFVFPSDRCTFPAADGGLEQAGSTPRSGLCCRCRAAAPQCSWPGGEQELGE